MLYVSVSWKYKMSFLEAQDWIKSTVTNFKIGFDFKYDMRLFLARANL